jgi:hypothetical protein
MTLFEYLAVFVSIVVSLGVVRLLEGLPLVLSASRRHTVHAAWVACVLVLHAQVWWAFWSYSVGVTWTYGRFLLVLVPMALLFSLAVVLVPREAHGVPSWAEHFERTRAVFFILFACFLVSIGISNWLVLEIPMTEGAWLPPRLAVLANMTLLVGGARIAHPWFQAALVALCGILLVLSVLLVLREPAPLGRVG